MGTRYRNILFASVGDSSRFPEFWLDDADEREFEVWICYYGDRGDAPFCAHADRYFEMKGYKYHHFQQIHESHRRELEHFEAFFIVDADIEIGTRQINTLFRVLREYDLWILQPSFGRDSRISVACTERIPGAKLHFTNYVENGVPLFSRHALERFMAVYDNRLLGWGTEYLYLWANGLDSRNRYAVVDEVECINPPPPPGMQREIDTLAPPEERVARWREVRDRLGVVARAPITYSVLVDPQPFDEHWALRPHFSHRVFPRLTGRLTRTDDGFEVLRESSSGDTTVRLNESAALIATYCDGRSRLRDIPRRIIADLSMPQSEIPRVRRDTLETVRNLHTRELIQLNYFPASTR